MHSSKTFNDLIIIFVSIHRNVIQIVDKNMLIFDPKPEEAPFMFQGKKQRRDITKKQSKDQKFVFEQIFGPDSTNQELFESTTKDILDSLLKGYNCSGEHFIF